MEIYRDGNSIPMSEVNEIRRLVINRNVKNLLEIGTYRGNIAFSLYDLVVGEHEGSITSVDIKQSNDNHKQNKLYMEKHDLKDVHLTVTGSNRFFTKNDKKFDMVILDGEQSYDQVKNDFENSIDTLTEDGIIVMCRYRKSIPVQQVVNEIDGTKYNKVLIHTAHHLMTVSKKERVPVLPKVEVLEVVKEEEIPRDEVSNDEPKLDTRSKWSSSNEIG